MNNTKTQEVYSDLTLFTTPDKFFLEPKNGEELLVIERVTEEISVYKNHRHIIPAASSRKDFCGLLGIINLLSGPYLVIATQRDIVGYISGCAVWRLVKAELIPFRSSLNLSPEKQADNEVYLSMIEQVLTTPFQYFCYDYDLTHSLQRLRDISPDFWKQSLWERADQRFVWNGFLLSPFRNVISKKFCLPLMLGFVSINFCVVNGHSLNWIIVTRRSVFRAGTRLFRRGIDKDGNVANFVETEQIVEYQGDHASFVQIRGSIPLFWQQNPDLRLKPPPTMIDMDPQEQHSTCLKHLEEVATLYGKVVLVNLIDQKGAEGE
uniref:Phosphatidylinositol-3-phosphatase SAC1 n=1 Tax=Diabrotica virgifera virgifera TaxID=50390 RepID=A0A6P7H2B5_DIAVI